MNHNTLLIEIGTEELPARLLNKLAAQLAENIHKHLQQVQIDCGESTFYATPRRLAVCIQDVADTQTVQQQQKRGPSVAMAYEEDGTPSKAAQGFAKSCGVAFDQLGTEKTDKGEWLVYSMQSGGQALETLITDIIKQSVNTLSIPKRMRWGNKDIEFLRPIRWLVAMLGEQTLNCHVFDLDADNKTFGHRFHTQQAITIDHADNYVDVLQQQGKIIVDLAQRKQSIKKDIIALAEQYKAVVIMPEDLLDEVTALVEWPVALLGEFDEKFLALPEELLISTLQQQQ